MKKMMVNLKDDIALDITVNGGVAYARLALNLFSQYYLMKNNALDVQIIKLNDDMNDIDIVSYIKNKIRINAINKGYGKRYILCSDNKLWLTLEYFSIENRDLRKIQIHKPNDMKLGNYLTNVEEIDISNYIYIDSDIESLDNCIIYKENEYVWLANT